MVAPSFQTDPRITLPSTAGKKLSTSTVISSVAPLHRKPNKASGQETQLLFGHQFDVYSISRGWAWGQARSPVKGSRVKGYIGFVSSKYLATDIKPANHVISASRAPIFSKPSIKSHVVQSLHLGALVRGTGRHPEFIKMENTGYLHRNHLSKRGQAETVTDFVSIAEQHMGLPYIWGGISTDGLDCSGLVLSSLRATGRDAPRDADMMEASLGERRPVSQRGLKRGDLIFWKGHVGIMQSSIKMIHANAFHMEVKSELLRDAVQRIKARGGGPVTSIKRL